MVWGRVTMTGRTECHICQRNVTAWVLLQRQCQWAYCCALRPSAWDCIHLSRGLCKSPLCTCCPRSPALSQNHDSPMASEVPRPASNWTFMGHPLETSLETASQPQQEWHRISQATIGRLIRSMRRRCLAPLAANGGPVRYWDFCEIDILPLLNSKSSSSHVNCENFVVDNKMCVILMQLHEILNLIQNELFTIIFK